MLRARKLKVEDPLTRGPTLAEFDLGGLEGRLVELCRKEASACTKTSPITAALKANGVQLLSETATP